MPFGIEFPFCRKLNFEGSPPHLIYIQSLLFPILSGVLLINAQTATPQIWVSFRCQNKHQHELCKLVFDWLRKKNFLFKTNGKAPLDRAIIGGGYYILERITNNLRKRLKEWSPLSNTECFSTLFSGKNPKMDGLHSSQKATPGLLIFRKEHGSNGGPRLAQKTALWIDRVRSVIGCLLLCFYLCLAWVGRKWNDI